MKDEYITLIFDLLPKCNDLALLDLISRLLDESIQETT